MSVNEMIEGRNLIKRGEFGDDWQDDWTVSGNPLARTDSVTGKTYLQMTKGATVLQQFSLPVRPDTDAVYWISFSYEVKGNKPSNVKLTTDRGEVVFDEPFASRKGQENEGALAEFRVYEPFDIKGLDRSDKFIDLLVTSADGATLDGINVTDFKIDLRLGPLQLKSLSLDGRVIPSQVGRVVKEAVK